MVSIVTASLATAAAVVGGLVGWTALSSARVSRMIPRAGKIAEVEGARIHYVERGTGRPIVLIHGLGGQLHNFTHSLVSRLEDDFRVIAIDRPGYGYSEYDGDGLPTLQRQARIVASFIRTLGLEKPLVVGHSLGGALALQLAQEFPDLISGLVLICPLTQPISEVPDVFKGLVIPSPIARRIVSWTLAVPIGQLRGEQTLAAVFAPETPPADFVTAGGGALGLRPSAVWSTSSEASGVGDEMAALAARYPETRTPTAILFAQQDAILDPALHGERTAAALPDATLRLIPGGHMIPVTAPDAVAAFIRERAAA